jgi:hypothetical protein
MMQQQNRERRKTNTMKGREKTFTKNLILLGCYAVINCLLKDVIEGKLQGRIEMTGRRGRRRKQLLDDLKEKRGYWKLKEEALDRTLGS